MSSPTPVRPGRLRWLIPLTLVMVLGIPISVIAAHAFDDVPDSNTFHDAIGWLAENEITLGCNPPSNTEFCPTDNVTRQQMAGFMRRLAETSGNAGAQIVDFASNVTISGTALVEVLSIDVGAKSEASVSLAGHVTLEKSAATEGRYEALIARGDCSGPVVGSGWWRSVDDTATFEADTISFTGFDVTTGPTTYALCVHEAVSSSPDATASRRGLTANWSPTT
jgi:hypothetical protein